MASFATSRTACAAVGFASSIRLNLIRWLAICSESPGSIAKPSASPDEEVGEGEDFRFLRVVVNESAAAELAM